MKKVNSLQLIGLILLISFLSVNLISATDYKLICMVKGDILKFSLCNPAILDRSCSTSSGCNYCVSIATTGAYCPANMNLCNNLGIPCTYLSGNGGGNNPPPVTITPPFVVTQVSPADNFITTSPLVKFSYQLTNSINASYCSLMINGAESKRNSTKITTATNIINQTLNGGTYSWNINCFDKLGNNASSVTRTLTVNYVAPTLPTITLVNPATNYVANNNDNIVFSYSLSNVTSVSSCKLYVNNAAVATATKINSTINIISYQVLTGSYSWYIGCNNNLGNFNSETRTLSVNAPVIPPQPQYIVTLNSPQDKYLVVSSSKIVVFSYGVTNSVNITKCLLYVNNAAKASNSTAVTDTGNNISYRIYPGNNSWYINCTDKSKYSGVSPTQQILMYSSATQLGAVNLSLASPVDNYSVNGPVDVNFEYTLSNPLNINSCSIILN